MLADGLPQRMEGRLARGRAAAEARMVDTIAFRRPTGRTAQNEETGREEPEYRDLFTTRCEVTGRNAGDVAPRTVTIGSVERIVLAGGVCIPIGTAELRAGDEGVITAVGPGTDLSVMGNVYRVVGFGGRTWATKRRLDVVEV